MNSRKNWPLSAAATSLLMNPRTGAADALKLSIKELVVVGALTLAPVTEEHKRRKPTTVMHVRPGTQCVPDRQPLPTVYQSLLADHPQGGALRAVVAAAVKRRRQLADDVRKLALQDLATRGLVQTEKKLFRTIVTRTPLGEDWRVQPVTRLAEWRSAVEAGGPAAAAAVVAATAAPGLVLLLDATTLQGIDREITRATASDDGGASFTAYSTGDGDEDSVSWSDLASIDGLSGLDAAIDPGVDSGSADGGGGDGGGGD